LSTLLLLLFVVGAIGTIAELFLLEHVEDWQQWVPLALLAAGALLAAAIIWRPWPGAMRLLWWLGAASIVSGVVGVWLHLQGNLEFEREMSPDIGGWPLWKAVLGGATPALAPGTMAWFGALAMLAVRAHGGGRSGAGTPMEERA
jgi:hypothetical protein